MPFGTPISCLRAALGGLGTAGVRALAAPGRSTITTARSAPATGAVEKVAAVTAVRPPSETSTVVTAATGLDDPSSSMRPASAAFSFDGRTDRIVIPSISTSASTRKTSPTLALSERILPSMTPLGCRAPATCPGVAPVAPGAGQFDVETIRHAPVKLPSAAGFAKRGSPEGRESPHARGRIADVLQPQSWNLTWATSHRQRRSDPGRPGLNRPPPMLSCSARKTLLPLGQSPLSRVGNPRGHKGGATGSKLCSWPAW